MPRCNGCPITRRCSPVEGRTDRRRPARGADADQRRPRVAPVAGEVAREQPFLDAFGRIAAAGPGAGCRQARGVRATARRPRLRRAARSPPGLPAPSRLDRRRRGVGEGHQPHPLPGGARPETFDAFVDRYRARLVEVLGDHSPYLYTFKRILLWARSWRVPKRGSLRSAAASPAPSRPRGRRARPRVARRCRARARCRRDR